jgi:hypothetical protein
MIPAAMRMAKAPDIRSHVSRLGWSWVLLWAALALHVADEALTGFLAIYNPTVIALRDSLGFWPMPTFEFREWLTGLIVVVLVLAALSPFAFRNSPWLRPLFYLVTLVAGVFNAMGHIIATIFGQTVSSVRFSRPAPGFYSSPVLLAVAVYALVQLRRTRY